jgi:hypothetical protein
MNRELKRLLEDVARGEIGPAISARARGLLAPRKRVARDVGPDRKAQRKATKRQSDRAVYAEVTERDAGLCTVRLPAALVGECSGRLEIDHQWGRGKAPTTVANCRKLCKRHHDMKGASDPSRVMWLNDFRLHAEAHGYATEADKATALRWLEEAQHPEARAPRGGRQAQEEGR